MPPNDVEEDPGGGKAAGPTRATTHTPQTNAAYIAYLVREVNALRQDLRLLKTVRRAPVGVIGDRRHAITRSDP